MLDGKQKGEPDVLSTLLSRLAPNIRLCDDEQPALLLDESTLEVVEINDLAHQILLVLLRAPNVAEFLDALSRQGVPQSSGVHIALALTSAGWVEVAPPPDVGKG